MQNKFLAILIETWNIIIGECPVPPRVRKFKVEIFSYISKK